MNRIKIYMGSPSLGERSDTQVYALREIEKKYAETIELVYPTNFTGRIFHDFARNCIVEEFMQSNCDVLWFLDSDVTPPVHILDLFETIDSWDMAGAAYPVWMRPHRNAPSKVVMCVYKEDAQKRLVHAECPTTGFEFVEGIATGCIFVKKHVFAKLEKPYFEFKYNAETREMTEGEDLGFCRKTNALGLKFFIDYSMVCSHHKKVDLLEVNNYTLLYAKDAMDAYDKHMKAVLTRHKLQQEALKQKKANANKSGIIIVPG